MNKYELTNELKNHKTRLIGISILTLFILLYTILSFYIMPLLLSLYFIIIFLICFFGLHNAIYEYNITKKKLEKMKNEKT